MVFDAKIQIKLQKWNRTGQERDREKERDGGIERKIEGKEREGDGIENRERE